MTDSKTSCSPKTHDGKLIYSLLEEVRADVKSHGEMIARLDERTSGHTARITSLDRRAARWGGSVGAVSGAIAAALAALLKELK